jgi:hypothetical protein
MREAGGECLQGGTPSAAVCYGSGVAENASGSAERSAETHCGPRRPNTYSSWPRGPVRRRHLVDRARCVRPIGNCGPGRHPRLSGHSVPLLTEETATPPLTIVQDLKTLALRLSDRHHSPRGVSCVASASRSRPAWAEARKTRPPPCQIKRTAKRSRLSQPPFSTWGNSGIDPQETFPANYLTIAAATSPAAST